MNLSLQAYASHQVEYDLARKVLDTLDKTVYHEIRTMHTPPQSLYHVLACAALILGETDVSWPNLQKFFLHCKKMLLEYDFDSAPREPIQVAKKYAEKNVKFWSEDRSKFASEAGYYIFIWCRDIFQLDNHRAFLEQNGISYANVRSLFSTRSFQKPETRSSKAAVHQEPLRLEPIESELDAWNMDHIWMEYAASVKSNEELTDKLDHTPDTPTEYRTRTPSI